MTFKTQMAADVSTVFLNSNEFAESGLFTSYDGLTVNAPATGIIEYDQSLTDFGNQAQASVATLHLSIATVSAIRRYDMWTSAAGIVWRIESIISHDDDVWRLAVSTDRRMA